MAQHKVRKCKYDKDNFKNLTYQNFTVDGNTEAAVKMYLEKIHKGHKIVVKEIEWA
jgi:hypothetical protein